ncbi:transmembrane protein 272-like [Megalobrama amblycephala]|uniref:transmembrane protein 272-like n=1 Tax=Megalobrama amblycephala TaxID=75352 RepID=UPI0020141866|nr:transmembrane protein 272-like [Megalobrama amblycephala]
MEGLLQAIPTPPILSKPVQIISKVIGAVLPIAEIAIGAIYLHDCPKQPYIPIYLLVSGVITLVLDLLAWLPSIKTPAYKKFRCFFTCAWSLFVCLFLFCWFIAGNVWIYSIHLPNYSGTDYCNKTLYLFAFWTTTVIYILLGIALSGQCYKECNEVDESSGNVVNV